MTERPEPAPQPATGRHWAGTWPLAVPLLGLAWPPLYNRLDPAVFGVPFFYAYQLAMIVVALGCMIAAYGARRR